MKKRVLSLALAMFLLSAAISLAACSNNAPPNAPQDTKTGSETSETTDVPPDTGKEENNADRVKMTVDEAYQIYADHIEKVKNAADWDFDYTMFSLVYIDDDDIPELFIETGFAYSGATLSTVSDKGLKTLDVEVVNYIERSACFLDSGGKQGWYYDTVYTMQDGDFVAMHEGFSDTADPDSSMHNWSWDGQDIGSELEYVVKLTDVFDTTKAAWAGLVPNSYEEIIRILNG